jgi:ssRNA-specific RNase YbeY (16S rRNA maturation enzyme)
MLHLLGYDHEESREAKKMRAREKELLEKHSPKW